MERTSRTEPGTNRRLKTKFIFVTGGVTSSLGKGLSAAAIGALLESRGLQVTIQKLDPYINVDPGTMNPKQHGEVFVTDDGAETDLDLGHYERFTHAKLSTKSNFTTGQVYRDIIERERSGDFLGQTVQVIPHITDEIKRRVVDYAQGSDISIVEIGGTVGDIESLPFIEAIRQMKKDMGAENVIYVHLTLVPYIDSASEFKTKPTQHSVKTLREMGIQPDILLCRSSKPFDESERSKIAMFCDVDDHAVINAVDVPNIYQIVLRFHSEGLDEYISERLNIWTKAPDLSEWIRINEVDNRATSTVKIAIVGKYENPKESYKSLTEALHHGAIENNSKLQIEFIDSEELNQENSHNLLEDIDGILVPGGFGLRGIEGKIQAIKYARENNIPFFGICLGMQMAAIEFARNVAGIENALSFEPYMDGELDEPANANFIIHLMDEQKDVSSKGGTMRLGGYDCELNKETLAYDAYGEERINERHRHRLEFNDRYKKELEDAGLIFSGVNPKTGLVEVIELNNETHPWFVACQYHPEFKSRPTSAHPLFRAFITASLSKK